MTLNAQLGKERLLINKAVEACSKSVDETGFVRLARLADVCNCEILLIPLLVEAAISRREGSIKKWSVLLNSDIFGEDHSIFEDESSQKPLGSRLRNTLAHEVAHAVAYETLGENFGSGKDSESKLRSLETTIEKTSPLLLLPQKIILEQLDCIPEPISALSHFSRMREFHGVSREIFIRSLNVFRKLSMSRFASLDAIKGCRYGVLKAEGFADFNINKIFTFVNYIGGDSHPIVNKVISTHQTSWSIVDMEGIDFGVSCKAVSNDLGGNEVTAIFDIEKAPSKAGESLFFCLRGEMKSPT